MYVSPELARARKQAYAAALANSGRTEEELKAIALKFLWINRRKVYLKLKRDGDLDEFIQYRVYEAVDLAQDLIRQGTFDRQAWSWAIRASLLESEMD